MASPCTEDPNNTDLYQATILDHNAHPRNFGPLEDATHTVDSFNPSCGDRFSLAITLQNDTVEKIRFQGSGCAISTASMSLFTEATEGFSLEKMNALQESFIKELLCVPISPGRHTCAMAPLRAWSELTQSLSS